MSHVKINPLFSKTSKLYGFSLEGAVAGADLTFNQEVMGSSPIALTNEINELH